MNASVKVSATFCSDPLAGRGCEGGNPPLLSHLPGKQAEKEKLQQSEIVSSQLRVWMEQPLEQTPSGRFGPPLLPGERCTEKWDTHPLGGVPVLREEEKDTDVAVRDVLLALLIETLCINREKIQQRSEMVFLSRKLNI